MHGHVLPTASAILMPLLLMFSIFLLLRGHNELGGGFSGGLVAATAFVLLSIARGVAVARSTLRVDPRTLIGGGLVAMLAAGLVASIVSSQPYLTAIWWEATLPAGYSVSIGTPLLFDVGVYLAVAGTTLAIAFALEEEDA